jgi:NAD(P)-dependent dehydrogenase (short-subunit alcohol dehydrogenase family)
MSNHTSVEGTVALVTGANRGIGAAFVSGLLEAGAQQVYAAARDPQTLTTLAQRDEGRPMPTNCGRPGCASRRYGSRGLSTTS